MRGLSLEWLFVGVVAGVIGARYAYSNRALGERLYRFRELWDPSLVNWEAEENDPSFDGTEWE